MSGAAVVAGFIDCRWLGPLARDCEALARADLAIQIGVLVLVLVVLAAIISGLWRRFAPEPDPKRAVAGLDEAALRALLEKSERDGEAASKAGDERGAGIAFGRGLAAAAAILAKRPGERAATEKSATLNIASAYLRARTKRLEAALGHARVAVAARETLARGARATAEDESRLAEALVAEADMLSRIGRADEAIAAARRALGIRERLAAREPENRDRAAATAHYHEAIAEIALAAGRSAEAIASYGKQRDIFRGLVASEPEDVANQMIFVYSLESLANADERNAARHLDEAISVLGALERRGGLDAADNIFLDDLKAMRAEL